jgi:hypothetical protein
VSSAGWGAGWSTGSGSQWAADGGAAAIVLTRVKGGYRDLLRGYRVLINGVERGVVRRGQQLRIELPSGLYRLQLKIDWCTSQEERIYLRPAELGYFSCAPGGDPLAVLAAISFGKDQYVSLWRTEGPPQP